MDVCIFFSACETCEIAGYWNAYCAPVKIKPKADNDNENIEVTKEFFVLKNVSIFDSRAFSEPPNLTDVGLV